MVQPDPWKVVHKTYKIFSHQIGAVKSAVAFFRARGFDYGEFEIVRACIWFTFLLSDDELGQLLAHCRGVQIAKRAGAGRRSLPILPVGVPSSPTSSPSPSCPPSPSKLLAAKLVAGGVGGAGVPASVSAD